MQEVKGDPSRGMERWFYSDWLRSSWFQAQWTRQQRGAVQPLPEEPPRSGEALEEPRQSEAGETAALLSSTAGRGEAEDPLDAPANRNLLQPSYDTPTPRFWSMDNPIVAAMTLIAALGLVSWASNAGN